MCAGFERGFPGKNCRRVQTTSCCHCEMFRKVSASRIQLTSFLAATMTQTVSALGGPFNSQHPFPSLLPLFGEALRQGAEGPQSTVSVRPAVTVGQWQRNSHTKHQIIPTVGASVKIIGRVGINASDVHTGVWRVKHAAVPILKPLSIPPLLFETGLPPHRHPLNAASRRAVNHTACPAKHQQP